MWAIVFALEFERDPEIPSFNKIVLYVKGERNYFDEDWEKLKKINKEIRNFSLKDLFSLDLW